MRICDNYSQQDTTAQRSRASESTTERTERKKKHTTGIPDDAEPNGPRAVYSIHNQLPIAGAVR